MTDQELDALNDEADALWDKLDRAEAEVQLLRHNWTALRQRINAEERRRLELGVTGVA